MHRFSIGLASATLLVATTPAAAQDAPGPVTVSGGVTLVSDYRFRGISQTDEEAAIQGSLTVQHESGLYVSVWGSSIDDYVAAGSDQEIDFIAGYRTSLGGTSIDVGVLYYHYPGAGGADTDFFEPFVAVSQTFGPVSAKVTAAYAPKQDALTIGDGAEDNFYLGGDLSTGLPGTPITLSAHLGHSFGPSYLTIGDGYTDWSLGASYTWNALTVGVSYVDTDGSFITPSGRDASDATVLFSIGAAF